MNEVLRALRFVGLTLCCVLSASAAFSQEQEPLTLKQAVTLAVQYSSDLALARARYAVAEQQAAFVRSPFAPNLFAGSGVGYTLGFPMTVGGAPPAIFDVAYVQTVFNRPLQGQAHAAERRTEVERLTLDDSRDRVILRTAEVFLDLVQVRQALEARRGARNASARIVEITDSRVAEGHELPVESLRAKLDGARAEQAIVQLEGREGALAIELEQLTGIRSDTRPLEVVADRLAAQPEQPTADLVARALASNSELRRADYEQRARRDQLRQEHAAYWPAIDVVGEYAMLARFNNYDEFFLRFERNNLNVGIQARWPIFSAQTTSAVRVVQAELRHIDVELRHRREEIEAAVRRASQRTRELNVARDTAALEFALAEEQVRMLQERFHADRANLRDVERARLDETDKRVAFLQADFDSQQAMLELLNSTGQLARVFP
jgi:outer membrane protein TolC